MPSDSHSPRLYPGVMISSTFSDLEHHRAALIKALKGEGLTDLAMENDSATLLDVIDSSLQMVRDASAYILVIGRKYGQTPVCPKRNRDELSITELEFNEALRLTRPILLFLMGDDHLVRFADVEPDPTKRKKLDAFRERAKKMGPDSQVHRVYATFESPEDFAVEAVQAVAGLRRYLDEKAAIRMPPLLTPAPTIPIPHELPLAAENFVGRTPELERLKQRIRDRKNTAVVGDAGMGKTALAAEALRAVVGEPPKSLAGSPYPDGVVYLDLYTMHGDAEAFWSSLANKLAGPDFMERSPARDRAVSACQSRNALIVIEGGEEANGQDGRPTVEDLLGVLSPQNRYLLLTRPIDQALPAQSIVLREALSKNEAAQLFDSITHGSVPAPVRMTALDLLKGHPLALTWAANLLARGDEDPERLLADWSSDKLLSLSDPRKVRHTLKWLFERSARGLDSPATRALAAAGLLAHAPFSVEAISAALNDLANPDEDVAYHALRTLVQRSLLARTADDQWQFTHVLGYRFARNEDGSDPELRIHLGNWLYEALKTALAVGSKHNDPAFVTPLLDHLAALLRADDDQSLWDPLVNAALYNFRDRLKDLGRLGQVRTALDAVVGWLDRFPSDKLEESYWLRERSVTLNRLGDVLQEQGDLAGALASYRQSLEERRRQAASDPSNAGWQRNLSVSHEKVGNVLLEQGDLAGAQAAYQQSMEIDRCLAASDPSNAVGQRDLSISHNKVGDVLLEQGDLAGALVAYQQSLEIIQRLAASDPSNTEWQRDLSVSFDNLGDVLLAQGDSAGAKESYERSLDIRQRLAASDPSNAVWQRDLSFTLWCIAELHQRKGARAKALTYAQESLKIAERLAALDPTNATWQGDVKFSRALVARLQKQIESV